MCEPNEISRYWEALKEVVDPEFPISVVDMGLITDIKKQENDSIDVWMTFTSTACACMDWIQEDIKARLLQEPDVAGVNIQVTWDKAWTHERLTEKGRNILHNWGVTV
ncbi:metal-sulfur cluster assembly factor [Fodinisporobacter ferrooxydans]|uniref:Metal-sulfur cluster assembly factor n=1 Tax=Fodinisporobacter ferrooxydans TaxID=2901836 RepID=A0ABY4CFJ5_9BACL|nr:metal-sulfur cluster assembly factor [Alicyclobacillaceae bacterium MYW30-H2]